MAGIRAIGVKLSYTEGTLTKYVAHLTSLGSLSSTNEEIDVTDMDSPNGNKEYIAGLTTNDNLSFSGNVAPNDDTFTRLWALKNARTVKAWKITYANGDTFTFNGYVASAKMGEQSTDGLMGYEGEIKISGDPIYTPSTESE